MPPLMAREQIVMVRLAELKFKTWRLSKNAYACLAIVFFTCPFLAAGAFVLLLHGRLLVTHSQAYIKLAGHSKTLQILAKFEALGIFAPVSYLLINCFVQPSLSASASWDNPRDSLAIFIRSGLYFCFMNILPPKILTRAWVV
jgi:hypothetical protein